MTALQRVVVTGIGVLAPGVADAAEFGTFLQRGQSALRPLRGGEWPGLPAGSPAARLEGFDTLARLAALPAEARRAGRGGSRALVAGLATGLAALADAGLAAPAGFGTVVAGSNLAQGRSLAAARKWLEQPAWTPPGQAHEVFDTHLGAVLAEAAGLHGPGLSVGAASASGNTAVAVAADLIALGRMPGCVVLAPPPDLSPVEWQALRSIGALVPPGQACRPFDAATAGFAPGEACVALVLESLDHARARGARPRAEIAGHGQAQQARRGTAPDAASALAAMRQALAMAGIAPGQLDQINAHATGTPAGDAAEARALQQLLDGAAVPINATKSLTGHAIQGAALVELAAVILQMEHSFLHGTAGLSSPIVGDLRLVGPEGIARHESRWALSAAHGFGGLATAVVLRNGVDIA
ncbi:beta-ketoacyl synthase N-terminal-like domain-containing protein [Roseomonas sp. USHLN139]|uniref:beta-ketoacyl synthase N-terminal-like domain-containing protein n=1 Tax=Roseomonas sp. USHLN139 TaxID=3081298 RepID=UPI003B014981